MQAQIQSQKLASHRALNVPKRKVVGGLSLCGSGVPLRSGYRRSPRASNKRCHLSCPKSIPSPRLHGASVLSGASSTPSPGCEGGFQRPPKRKDSENDRTPTFHLASSQRANNLAAHSTCTVPRWCLRSCKTSGSSIASSISNSNQPCAP